MTIYDFSLASMYEVTGADSAMCYRAGVFREKGYEVKMIFTTPPTVRDLLLYRGKGLEYNQLLSVHSYFTDIQNLAPVMRLETQIEHLKNVLECSQDEMKDNHVILYKAGKKKAAVLMTEDGDSFYTIDYFDSQEQLARTDFYADVLYATAFYEMENGRISERFFYNRDGSVALLQKYEKNQEWNIFPDGARYNNAQIFGIFVRKLGLTKDDVVILDRALGIFSAKALFECYEKTNIVAIIHSEHDNRRGYSFTGEYLNREYWYWCKYSRYIHMMIVGTEEQKLELAKTLKQYHFFVPEIRALSPTGLTQLHYPEEIRKRKAIVCVSRLDMRKKVDWTILTAVKAHELDEEITLDIYGGWVDYNYAERLRYLIEKYDASGYITLKGHADVTEVYQKYKVFLTTSLWETFGITLLEAAGSGLPLVGLDVRYGNRLFIEDGRNGYLVEYNPDHFYEECPSEVEALAQRIVEILSEEEKWKAFSARSYEIAEEYLSEKVKQKWYDLIPS